MLLIFVFFNNFLMCLCGFHDFLDNFYFWDLQFLVVCDFWFVEKWIIYSFWVCFDVWRRGFMEILRFFFFSIFSFLACDDLGIFGC